MERLCTNMMQSRKLIDLGLKRETCDAVGGDGSRWSMFRLIEMYISNKDKHRLRLKGLTYDKMIRIIEKDIKQGTFNNEYLI